MNMLEGILSPEECAQCRFCCSFRRSSLWETPVFEPELLTRLRVRYPEVKFKLMSPPLGEMSRSDREGQTIETMTVDLEGLYRTDDPDEEVPCYFNKNGCILGDDKPFDCKIWPLYIMRCDDELVIALAPNCRVVASKPFDDIQRLVDNGLGERIFDYAALHPEFIQDYREGYKILMEAIGDRRVGKHE